MTPEQEIKVVIGSILSVTITNTVKTLSALGILADVTKDPHTANTVRSIMLGLQKLLNEVPTAPPAPETIHEVTELPEPIKEVSEPVAEPIAEHLTSPAAYNAAIQAGTITPPERIEKTVDYNTLIDIFSDQGKEMVEGLEKLGYSISNRPPKEEPAPIKTGAPLRVTESEALANFQKATASASDTPLVSATREELIEQLNALDTIDKSVIRENGETKLIIPSPTSVAPEPDLSIAPEGQIITKEEAPIAFDKVFDAIKMLFPSNIVADGIGDFTFPEKIIQCNPKYLDWVTFFNSLEEHANPVLYHSHEGVVGVVIRLSRAAFLVIDDIRHPMQLTIQSASRNVLYDMEKNSAVIAEKLKAFINDVVMPRRFPNETVTMD